MWKKEKLQDSFVEKYSTVQKSIGWPDSVDSINNMKSILVE